MQKSELEETVKDAVRGAVLEGIPEDDSAVIEPGDVTEDEISAADALIDEIRGEEETTVNVYRIGAGRGKETFLYAASPEDITAKDIMERCRDQHGGGDFKMVTRDASRIVKSARFSVEKPQGVPEPEKKSDGIGTLELLTILQNQNAQTMQMFQSTMTAFAEAFKGNQQPTFNPNEATKTIMESVAAIKSLTDAPRDNSGKEMVEMLIQGITLAREIGGKDGDTNSNDILLKAMDYLPALAEGAKHLQPPGAPGAPGPGQPHPDPDTQASIEREHRMAQEKAAWAMNVQLLLSWAQNGKDPALYADVILDQMGEEAVLEFINRPDALEFLAKINPDVMTFRGWFEALRDEILDLTKPEPDLTPGAPAADTPIEGELQPAGEADGVQSDGDDNRDANRTSGRNGGGPGDA